MMAFMASRRQFLACALYGGPVSFWRAEPVVVLSIVRTKTKLAVVPIFIGEVRLGFVVDTGATNTVIAAEALDRLAPDDFDVRGATSVIGTGGRAPARRITLRSLAVSRGEGMPLVGTVIDLSPFRNQFGADVDGVLGMDVLQRYSLRFDFRKQWLDLLAARAAIDKRNALASVVFEVDQQRKIRFPAQLNGHPVTAILDTGAIQSGVNWTAAQQAGTNRSASRLREESKIVGVDGTRQVVHEYQFAEMRIGSLRWKHPTLVVADVLAFEAMQLGAKPAAIVGMDFLDNREITVSFSEGRLTIR